MGRRSATALAVGGAGLAFFGGAAGADAPWPRCEDVAGCQDPSDYGSYLRSDVLPDDFGGGAWKYLPGSGMNITGAWSVTTGRPDVVVAVLDSGIRWREADLALKAALNTDELPVPVGCPAPVSPRQHSHDCDGDGAVNVLDFAGQRCPGGIVQDTPDDDNAILDAGDLIRLCSDGVDGWGPDAVPLGNGFVDDISGWDFVENDNDPFDDVDYGHGTGEAGGMTAEANNGFGSPGFAPSAMFLPLRVGDSFVAVESDFVQGVVYAVDWGVDIVSEALGTISGSRVSQAAIDYAYHRGVPVIASAADEESRHHNLPAAFEHTIWVNSIRDGDSTIGQAPVPGRYDILNGCTNYGGHAWVAISSSSCSSEATERAAGLTALLISHGRNRVEQGQLEPWDAARGIPYSAEEVRQLLRVSTEDIDHSGDLSLVMDPLLDLFLSGIGGDPLFESTRFPTQAGWDQYTGYGRPEAVRLLQLADGAIPPEADLSGGPRWFDVIDPALTPEVPIVGSAAAERADGFFEWEVEAGCGVQPDVFTPLDRGRSMVRLERATLTRWDPARTAEACGFDPAENILDPNETDPNAIPDAHTVTLRLRVYDRLGRMGEDRRTLAIHSDPSLRVPPVFLGTSGEAAPALVDVDRDGALDIVLATGDGSVHVLDGDGRELPGFPVTALPVPMHPSPALERGRVPLPRESFVASVAADDLDGDGSVEIVAASFEGTLYVWDAHGRPRPGFPVTSNPAFSRPENRDRCNDTDPGFASAPTLADLDAPDGPGDLEIVIGGMDGHLYAWRADGSPQPGFPVRLADRAKLAVDDATGTVTPLDASGTPISCAASGLERVAKIVSSPAVGDLDGDGRPEIVVGTNEEYRDGEGFASQSFLLSLLLSGAVDIGDFDVSTVGRVYAVESDGMLHRDGSGSPAPFRPGWPVAVPILQPQVLPTVATGIPGAPVLADLAPGDADPRLAVAVFGSVGPVVLLDPDGEPLLGRDAQGLPQVLAADFPAGGFPSIPPGVGSADAPFFAALGSSAFGDVDGDGLPELAAPTGGIRQLIDVAAPGRQEFGDHQITLWDPRSGGLYGPDPTQPVFPRQMDDMQFLGGPSLADVDGDGRADVLQGSGAYLVRAYRADGAQPAGWPKFTHGWLIGGPTPGDVDGDGLLEVVALTREGSLFIWDTPAPDAPGAVQWQGFGGDRRNSGNLAQGVPRSPAPATTLGALQWQLESIRLEWLERLETAPPRLARLMRRSGAGAALERALVALEDGRLPAGAEHARAAWQALGRPRRLAESQADLRERLEDALAAAARSALAAATCADGDDVCRSRLSRWGELLERADRLDAGGRDATSLRLRVRVLILASRWT